MARTYTCEPHIIELTINKMKETGLIAQDASFNTKAPQNLRKEIAYRDFDFLLRLSRTAESKTVDSIHAWLIKEGVLPAAADYNDKAFEALAHAVREEFTIPGSSISPVMCRLLYMLSSVKQPMRTIGLGTYCGYALVWAVGAGCGADKRYDAEIVYGIDIDERATQQARENFKTLANTNHIKLLAEDGLVAVKRLSGPFDLVFLDVDSRELGKGIYLDLLEGLYDKIPEGGWVLAHDTQVPPFAKHLEGYLAFVRDRQNFRESIAFDVDPFGLELSIK